MADQGKWFKLWCTALRDDDLENLSIHQWFAWARLGVHIKEHGKEGKLRIRKPAISLLHLLRVPDFESAVSMIKSFPNVVFEEGKNETVHVTVASVSYEITWLNWNKYQGDYSTDRTRKWRAKRTANVTRQEEKRREEKRGEETLSPKPPLPSAVPTSKANGQHPGHPGKIQKPVPGHYEVPESEIMTAEDFAKVRQAIEKKDPAGTLGVAHDDVF